jgi:hypothetical protein
MAREVTTGLYSPGAYVLNGSTARMCTDGPARIRAWARLSDALQTSHTMDAAENICVLSVPDSLRAAVPTSADGDSGGLVGGSSDDEAKTPRDGGSQVMPRSPCESSTKPLSSSAQRERIHISIAGCRHKLNGWLERARASEQGPKRALEGRPRLGKPAWASLALRAVTLSGFLFVGL